MYCTYNSVQTLNQTCTTNKQCIPMFPTRQTTKGQHMPREDNNNAPSLFNIFKSAIDMITSKHILSIYTKQYRTLVSIIKFNLDVY
jgi:hypothetical protein